MNILLAHQEAYDAIVLHMYLTPLEFGPGGLKDRTPEDLARWVWVRSDGDMVEKIFGTVHALAPKKEIWVTEWAFNSTQYVSQTTDPRWQVHQTMLAMFYDARFMLNVAYRVPFVTIMTNWTLYSQPAVCLITADGETTIKYELFRLLRLAREGSDRLARLQIEHNPVWHGPPGGHTVMPNTRAGLARFSGFFSGEALEVCGDLEHSGSPRDGRDSGASRHPLGRSRPLPGYPCFRVGGNANNPPVAEMAPLLFQVGKVARLGKQGHGSSVVYLRGASRAGAGSDSVAPPWQKSKVWLFMIRFLIGRDPLQSARRRRIWRRLPKFVRMPEARCSVRLRWSSGLRGASCNACSY